MARISTYLDPRPYQVAVSNDVNVIFRKWDHKGTSYSVTHRDAAFKFGIGQFVGYVNPPGLPGTTFQFMGNFVHVGFGS